MPMMLWPLEICDLSSTRFNPPAFLPSDAHLVMTNDGFMSGMVAISALSEPQIFRMVRPSIKKSLALPSLAPTTPTMPQHLELLLSFKAFAASMPRQRRAD
jgi:hypothetical protein